MLTNEVTTISTTDFNAPTEKEDLFWPSKKKWKFDKMKMYCFFTTSDATVDFETRKKVFIPDEHTPIEERYIMFR